MERRKATWFVFSLKSFSCTASRGLRVPTRVIINASLLYIAIVNRTKCANSRIFDRPSSSGHKDILMYQVYMQLSFLRVAAFLLQINYIVFIVLIEIDLSLSTL